MTACSLASAAGVTPTCLLLRRTIGVGQRTRTWSRQPAGTDMTPIQLYTYQTPNGHKASIMLEETGLPYDVHIVDIERGDQHAPAFLALNPNNKIPVITDPDRGRTVFESGAILPYL